MAKVREYVCCALPMINAGIYFTLIWQIIAALVVGVLALATPDIVGAATPAFCHVVLGIICLVCAAIQVIGLIGIAKEKAGLFRRYLALHTLSMLAAFAVAAAWIVWGGLKLDDAKSECRETFYDTSDSDQASQANTLCNVFAYVDIGIMAGLWVWMAIMQGYLYFVLHSYSSQQVEDHAKYDALNESARAFNDAIPMKTRGGDAYNPRPSTDTEAYGHRRQDSGLSMSDVMSQPVHQPLDTVSEYSRRSPPPVGTAAPRYSDEERRR
ncbi:hypothetical protein CYLTODRAFT_383608 [Cylindrobasidium torrendii FP15055 ss-10]|uniref:Uncharacterized protein n=1 Tax=Cylindrobasidium torrendii FP15055 ss-10 TaxID=1314674 RepID=A0A0D7AWT1_9AGAR|nr:hypothetical protein CYLTODRAFT_383608 [Cylindrobasidium torrendii FP15055 ss-10]